MQSKTAQDAQQSDIFDVALEVRVADGPYQGLVRVQTWQWLPWLVALAALVVWFGIEFNSAGSLSTIRFKFWCGFIFVSVLAFLVFNKLGALKRHYSKFVYTNPDDVIGFVRFDEVGVRYGVPKLQETTYAWVFFTKYRVKGPSVILSAPLITVIVDLTRASDQQVAEICAGLARVFSRPRVGMPFHIPHCMGCGYDLSGSPGPDCPECGRPFHRFNYRQARITDTSKVD